MPTRHAGAALHAAVNIGLTDLPAGRYVEADDDGLDDYLSELGDAIAERAQVPHDSMELPRHPEDQQRPN